MSRSMALASTTGRADVERHAWMAPRLARQIARSGAPSLGAAATQNALARVASARPRKVVGAQKRPGDLVALNRLEEDLAPP